MENSTIINQILQYQITEPIKPSNFKDRKRVSASAKKHKLTIQEQSPSEIIADIEYIGGVDDAGTAINANVMNNIESSVILSHQAANLAIQGTKIALEKADTADQASNLAKQQSKDAKEKAELAVSYGELAKQTAESALEQVAQKQGSIVISNNVILPEFNADTKVDSVFLDRPNKVLSTNSSGKVEASEYIPIGNIKCYQEYDTLTNEPMLTFEFLEV